MVAFRPVMLVQMRCRYKFEIVVTLGGSKRFAFRTVMLAQMWRRGKYEIVVIH